MADDDHRQKVTLALDDEDVTRTIGTMFQPADRAKFMDWPSAVYSMHPYDRVTVDGETSASRRGSATPRTRARCSRSPCSTRSTRSRGAR